MASSLILKKPASEPEVTDITHAFGLISMEKDTPGSIEIVDTAAALSELINSLEGLPTQPPSLYIDLKGENLSRNRTISILQLYISPTKHTYLVDIFTLGNESFTTSGRSGHTLQEVLQDLETPKVFFDVRNDSDALNGHYHIRLASVHDL